jgi:hypothetical protein
MGSHGLWRSQDPVARSSSPSCRYGAAESSSGAVTVCGISKGWYADSVSLISETACVDVSGRPHPDIQFASDSMFRNGDALTSQTGHACLACCDNY